MTEIDPATMRDNLRTDLVCYQRRHDQVENLAWITSLLFIGGIVVFLTSDFLLQWAWSHPHQSTAVLVLFVMLAVSALRALLGARWDTADVIEAIRGSQYGTTAPDSPRVDPAESTTPSAHPDLGVIGIAALTSVGLLKLLIPDVLGLAGTALLVARLVFGGLVAGLFLFWALRSLRSEPPDGHQGLPDEVLRRLWEIRRRSPRSSWATWLDDDRGRIELYLHIAVWTMSAIAAVLIWG
ncbi:MAG: hypothetical protein JXO72_09125 [Vicinamibacteria bacterium]|nr:hypothetical protein [Vicinamibacteria bacterium]